MSEAAYENLKAMIGDKVEKYFDPPFTPAEKRAVLTRPDHGIQRLAKMTEYSSLDDFLRDQNNFYWHFAKVDATSGNQNYRARRVLQRLELLNPELVNKLLDKIDQHTPFTDEQKADLYQAYREMAKLVDASDKGVLDKDGEVDSSYLTR